MIEKKIWQTYKNNINNLPDYIEHTTKSWINKNSDWEYNYLNDDDVDDFIYEEFGSEWSNLIKNKCLLKVMKYDVWRVMCVYKYGGLYADVDTICTESINSWIVDYKDKEFICGYENDNKIGQWCFLAKSQNKALENILENINKALKMGDIRKDSIFDLTGSGIFTNSILKNVTLEQGKPILHQNKLINDSEYFDVNKIHLIKDENFFITGKVVHLIASRFWNFDSYHSWNKEYEMIKNEII
jgi:mannosyltransferase OCH1-like enzyme